MRHVWEKRVLPLSFQFSFSYAKKPLLNGKWSGTRGSICMERKDIFFDMPLVSYHTVDFIWQRIKCYPIFVLKQHILFKENMVIKIYPNLKLEKF